MNARIDPSALADEDRWRAVLARDGARDGQFWFAVRTTGVYCRPSCPSRTPRRENVAFFASPDAARAAGFRACLRCRPDADGAHPHVEAVRRACRLLDEAEAAPSLGELADAAGLSRFHFARVFKALTGLTPMAYWRSRRRARLGDALAGGATVTAAIYDAGFNAPSRVYEGGPTLLGMTPSTYRAAGAGETIRLASAPCALGVVLVAATPKGVCAIELGDDAGAMEARVRARFAHAAFAAPDPEFRQWVDAVVRLVDLPRGAPDLPLDIRGTAFQQRVWQALREIPAGTTATYAAIAARIGAPRGARAVAQACAANALAVAVPCHRVVRGDGAPGGYRWGEPRKRELLRREATEPDPRPSRSRPPR
jgi:AraC family transcriptional regulator of adaptative response/methylated-DNA-[protein]-cysteine methyltransferase